VDALASQQGPQSVGELTLDIRIIGLLRKFSLHFLLVLLSVSGLYGFVLHLTIVLFVYLKSLVSSLLRLSVGSGLQSCRP